MLNYQIALTNTLINENNSIWFENRTQQQQYFGVDALFSNAIDVNFNPGDAMRTRLTYDVQADDLTTIFKNNYAIIKELSTNKYFYYFIDKIEYDTNKRVWLALRCDIIQTYFYNIDLSNDLQNVLIERAHTNRFSILSTNPLYAKFVIDDNNENFTNEPLPERSQYLVARNKIFFGNNIVEGVSVTNLTPFDEWIKANIEGWCYIFLKQDTYNFYDNVGNTYTYKLPLLKQFNYQLDYPTPVLCYPIYKDITKNITMMENGSPTRLIIDANGLTQFKDLNNNASNFYNMKFSTKAPFNTGELIQNTDYEITTSGDMIIYGNAKTSGYRNSKCCNSIVTRPDDENVNVGLFIVEDNKQYYSEKVYMGKHTSFLRTDIINATGNNRLIYQPKLLNRKYYTLKLIDNAGNSFDYDALKIGLTYAQFILTESLTPDITRDYVRLVDDTYFYSEGTGQNLTGLVVQNDTSIPFDNDKFSEFIANNKNFYLQTGLNQGRNAINNILGGIANGFSRGGVVGALAGSLTGGVNTGLDVTNKLAEIDNIKSAPNSVTNANGNILFNALYSEPGYYLERYEATKVDLLQDFNFYDKYGYTVNKIGQIRNYINTRKYFNYIQADIDIIKADLTNTIKDEIRTIFKNGIRFWHVIDGEIKNLNYYNENYELYLEE